MSLIRGLYAIADPNNINSEHPFLTACEQTLSGGCKVLQYRNKSPDQHVKRQQTKDLKKLCAQFDSLLIVNDCIELALHCEAHGVHLGQTDASICEARERLGEHAILGTTCHASIDLADKAITQSANYLAFGRFFMSRTKPDAKPANPSIITESKMRFPQIPVVAIGGITFDNAPTLINAGADCLAICHALFSSDDIKKTSTDLSALF